MDAAVWTDELHAFPEKTSYFGDPSKQWMINFREGNLNRLAAQLQAAGIVVKVDAATSPPMAASRIHTIRKVTGLFWQPVQRPRFTIRLYEQQLRRAERS